MPGPTRPQQQQQQQQQPQPGEQLTWPASEQRAGRGPISWPSARGEGGACCSFSSVKKKENLACSCRVDGSKLECERPERWSAAGACVSVEGPRGGVGGAGRWLDLWLCWRWHRATASVGGMRDARLGRHGNGRGGTSNRSDRNWGGGGGCKGQNDGGEGGGEGISEVTHPTNQGKKLSFGFIHSPCIGSLSCSEKSNPNFAPQSSSPLASISRQFKTTTTTCTRTTS